MEKLHTIKEELPEKEKTGEVLFKSLGEALEALGKVREIEDATKKLEAWKILKSNESFNHFWNDTIKILLSSDDREEMIKEFGEENV